jgi:hypothetical protein
MDGGLTLVALVNGEEKGLSADCGTTFPSADPHCLRVGALLGAAQWAALSSSG